MSRANVEVVRQIYSSRAPGVLAGCVEPAAPRYIEVFASITEELERSSRGEFR